jgi:SAM-dependent methyltransferase
LGLSFDRIADRYDTSRGYPENVMQDILGALVKALDKDQRILDAGVGTGRFAAPLQRLGYDIVGVDISNRMLAKAVEKGTMDLVRADICALPFMDRSFGTALSVHVLHLITNWVLALREISRVATKDLMSVAFNKEASPAEEIRALYDKICGELGYEIRHAGMRERELPGVLPADRAVLITTHEHPIVVEDMINDFEQRTYSSQWLVPEEIHQKAVEVLREQYEGVETVLGLESISLVTWNIDRVREFSLSRDVGSVR